MSIASTNPHVLRRHYYLITLFYETGRPAIIGRGALFIWPRAWLTLRSEYVLFDKEERNFPFILITSAGWLRGHVCGKGANVEYQLR